MSSLPIVIIGKILQDHTSIVIQENKFTSFLDRLESNLNGKNKNTSGEYSLFGEKVSTKKNSLLKSCEWIIRK